VANGGRLVTPHLVTDLGLPQRAPGATRAGGAEAADVPADDLPPIAPPEPIPALKAETLAAIRAGLVRTVEDPRGTAHATAHLECVTLAGKTGTAQTGGNRADHAWFAGYVPAEQQQVAFVVVLEHAGDAATAACPLAKRLVERMLELGLLEPGAGQRP
jgi:cell division protein FtsI/penicillin-binding protein 2